MEGKVYFEGKEVGITKDFNFAEDCIWSNDRPPDYSTADILANIKTLQGSLKFEATITDMREETRQMLFPKKFLIIAQNKSQIKRLKKNFVRTTSSEMLLGTILITSIVPTIGTSKYLKRMKNRIKLIKQGRNNG